MLFQRARVQIERETSLAHQLVTLPLAGLQQQCIVLQLFWNSRYSRRTGLRQLLPPSDVLAPALPCPAPALALPCTSIVKSASVVNAGK